MTDLIRYTTCDLLRVYTILVKYNCSFSGNDFYE